MKTSANGDLSGNPCPRCSSLSYTRKVCLDIEGKKVVVCNVCTPNEVQVPVQVIDDETTISTGFVRASLNWEDENPVQEASGSWDHPSRWQRFVTRLQRVVWPNGPQLE